MVSPPAKAVGRRSMGRSAVAPPRTTDQADRAGLDRRPASGTVKEPMMGIKTVSRTIVSMFMVGFHALPA